MNKVKAVCGSLGALGGGTLATAITFALIPVASVGAVAFAVGTVTCGKIGAVVGNMIENNPVANSIVDTIYNSEKLPKEYIDMEEY